MIFSKKWVLFIGFVFSLEAWGARIEPTVWGDEIVDDPIVERILDSKVMQRIRKVDQSGPPPYFGHLPFFTRYEHCVGVWALLRKVGVSKQEQIAGLLHDASHTAFSHLAELLFNDLDTKHSYQDKIHLWYLQRMGIHEIITKIGLGLEELSPDLPTYTALEQERPNICADRIHYILHTGVILNVLSKGDVQLILRHLKFENNRWFFDDQKAAKLFANLPFYLTRNLWEAPWDKAIYHYFVKILKRGIELGLINKDMIHFGTDEQILTILKNSNDPLILSLLEKCQHINHHYKVTEVNEGEIVIKPKFWGIDPWVRTDKGFKRLSDIDPLFQNDYKELKEWCAKGYGLTLI